MADSRQFGGPKVTQFGDRTGRQPGDSLDCSECEAMLADALDGTLDAADQQRFDGHMAHCEPCAQALADAKRGAAWLEMLRDPKPEPSAELLERILAQTSGAAGTATLLQPAPVAVMHPGVVPAYGKVIPFRARMAGAMRSVWLQPRLAMTAAMAFFSIALTMNLTGVRLEDIRLSNLKPSSLKRDFYSANARVVQYYEGLRVVYELESRVHDLQTANAGDATAPNGGSQAAPSDSAQPDDPNQDAQPGQTPPANGSPSQPQPKQQKPAGNGSSSRRDVTRRLEVAELTPPVCGMQSGDADAPYRFRQTGLSAAMRFEVEGTFV